MEAEIKLSYRNVEEAEAVAKAVSPDNIEVPLDLSVKTVRKGSEVITTIECQTKLQTLIATLDDFLSCITVAERSFSVAERV